MIKKYQVEVFFSTHIKVEVHTVFKFTFINQKENPKALDDLQFRADICSKMEYLI